MTSHHGRDPGSWVHQGTDPRRISEICGAPPNESPPAFRGIALTEKDDP